MVNCVCLCVIPCLPLRLFYPACLPFLVLACLCDFFSLSLHLIEPAFFTPFLPLSHFGTVFRSINMACLPSLTCLPLRVINLACLCTMHLFKIAFTPFLACIYAFSSPPLPLFYIWAFSTFGPFLIGLLLIIIWLPRSLIFLAFAVSFLACL